MKTACLFFKARSRRHRRRWAKSMSLTTRRLSVRRRCEQTQTVVGSIENIQLAERTQKATQEVEINISGLKQISTAITEVSETFSGLSTEVMEILEDFRVNIGYVNQNTEAILTQTLNVTNEEKVHTR